MGIHDVNQLDIIEAYRSGKSMSEIAFENECDFSIVRRVLEHFKIPRRRGDHVCPAYTRKDRWSDDIIIVRKHPKKWTYGTRNYK